jgi:hypothetical protein
MISGIGQDLNKLSTLSVKRQFLLVGLVSVLFALSILVGAYFLGSNTTPQKVEEGISVPTIKQQPKQTTLSISPASLNMTVGKPLEMTVLLETLPVSATDIVLQFDPAMISISNVQNGNIFDRVIRNKVLAGSVIFSAAVAPENKNNLKTGTVLRFTVTPLKAGSTSIAFDHKKTITAVNGTNTAGTLSNAQIQIQ